MTFLKYLLWPVLLFLCVFATSLGFYFERPILAFNLTYAALAISLFFLERKFPYEEKWVAPDGQTFANIAHTLTSKGTVQGFIVFGSIIGITSLITPVEQAGYGVWPREWPLPVQIIMGLVIAEFGLYWAHRIAHEWEPLWYFHAVHHSVKKLWIVNTGRFHFIDSLFSILLAIAILLALGAPMEVVKWLSATTAYIGMLTHCNVDMRFGFLSYIFNTPGLHRWHHSKDISEGNKNYGENLVLWDHVFGTFYNPDRRPPADIGIEDEMPVRFVDQLAYPFRKLFKLSKKSSQI